MGILAKIGAWAIIPLLYFHLNLNGQDLDELYFGTDETFEVMTWNIEWFPKNNQITVDYVTQIIQALDVDILAIQEVDDTDMFIFLFSGIKDVTIPITDPLSVISGPPELPLFIEASV